MKTLTPFRVSPDAIEKITVCTRPFRAAGPRIEAERVGEKLIVHNYGHGGAGWSLSWGSAARAVSLALAGGGGTSTPLAVIGCGALGLTSAVAAQRAGATVTIYAKDLPPETRSARATGAWTPDSRVALKDAMPASFPADWEAMSRTSWQTFAPYVDAPGQPLGFHSRYTLCGELEPEEYFRRLHAADPVGFAWLAPALADLTSKQRSLEPGEHPFPAAHVCEEHQLIFNLSEYTRQLVAEFHARGGHMLRREFHSPADLAQLPEPTVIHATGYGARQLFQDRTLTPVRGQIAWLPAQADANYSLFSDYLNVVSRRDGLVVQLSELGEATGWQNDSEAADLEEARRGVERLMKLQTINTASPLARLVTSPPAERS